jgi:alpha-beta hydrolase superfamily lysophospholipase
MRSFLRASSFSALWVWLALLPAGQTQAAEPEGIKFETADQITLTGSLYASNKGKKAPTVLLLHDFEKAKGGSSKADGIDFLAKALQEQGYAVLTFDFRGHGDSKSVGDKFWTFPHNRVLPGANQVKPPASIAQTAFPPRYYPHLIDDISAAKAYLDRENDNGNLNSKNLIVIGCGEGATLGIIWMLEEFKRYRATVTPNVKGPLFPPVVTVANNPEGKDIVCGIWLNPKTSVGGYTVPVNRALLEVAEKQKVPMLFLYGKEDDAAASAALTFLKVSVPGFKRGGKNDKEYQYTGEYPVPRTKLSSTKLLQDTLGTHEWILKNYLEPLITEKKLAQWEEHKNDEGIFYWIPQKGAVPVEAKKAGEKVPKMTPLQLMGILAP